MSNYAQNRQRGSVTVNGNTYQRQPVLTRLIKGKAISVGFGIDQFVPGRYVLIDADDLQPSHLGASQNPVHFIPEAQPRNRSASQSGALTPERIAQALRPAEVMEGATAYTGAPVINNRGEVIQGNGRAYMLKVYYAQFPNDERGYQKTLKKESGCLGLPETAIQKAATIGMTKPVLARLVDVSDGEAIRLGQFTQADTEAVASETTKIKSKVRLLTAATLRRLVDDLVSRDRDGDATLAELIRAGRSLQILIADGILRTDDLENYTRNQAINEAGVQFVSTLLLNALFRNADVNTSDVLKLLPVATQTALQKSTLYLLRLPPGKSLSREVGRAVTGFREFSASGSEWVGNWLNQYDLQGKTPADRYTPVELGMIRLFSTARSQKEVVDRFKTYGSLVANQPANLLSGPTPGLSKREAILSVFASDYTANTARKTRDQRANTVISRFDKKRSGTTTRRRKKAEATPVVPVRVDTKSRAIVGQSRRDFGNQAAQKAGVKRITDKKIEVYADPDYTFRIRDLIEKRDYASGLELYNHYRALRDVAHPDAHIALGIGLFYAAGERKGGFSTGPFLLLDEDARNIRLYGINSVQSVDRYFMKKANSASNAFGLQMQLEMELLDLLTL